MQLSLDIYTTQPFTYVEFLLNYSFRLQKQLSLAYQRSCDVAKIKSSFDLILEINHLPKFMFLDWKILSHFWMFNNKRLPANGRRDEKNEIEVNPKTKEFLSIESYNATYSENFWVQKSVTKWKYIFKA